MLNKRIEPELFGSTPDLDQVAQSKEPIAQSSKQAPSAPQNVPDTPAVKKSSNVFTWLGAISIIALAAGGYTLYQQNLATQVQLAASNQRIAELESALSATGEEMGESTIALKVKLEAISEKAEKLWSEMDKLWASAWRKNQSEIKALRSTSMKQDTLNKNQSQQISEANTAINNVSDKLTSAEFNITALADQISAANNLQPKIAELNSLISTLEEKSSGRDNQQMEIATSVNQLEMSITLLIERLEKIENQNKAQDNVPPAL
mgnify:CR=1 FL=1